MKSAQQRRSSAASKKLRKEPPPYDEMWDTIHNLGASAHPVAAIMGVSYLDHALEMLLRAKFVETDKDEDQKMFNPSSGGILGAFAAKVRMAYALDLLGPKTFHDLLLLSEIRNVFAHSLHNLTFNNKLIIEDCYKLQSVAPVFEAMEDKTADTAISRYLETVYIAYVFIRNNSFKLEYNKTEKGKAAPQQIRKDLF